SDRNERAVRGAGDGGVRVTLNLHARSNKLLYRRWVRVQLRRLNHPNITLYGFTGCGGMTHAKLVLVDDQWASFGSLNMIEVEGLTQKELNVFSSNPDLIAQLQTLIARDIAQSDPVPVPPHAAARPLFTVQVRLSACTSPRPLS